MKGGARTQKVICDTFLSFVLSNLVAVLYLVMGECVVMVVAYHRGVMAAMLPTNNMRVSRGCSKEHKEAQAAIVARAGKPPDRHGLWNT
jgi:hypothetical protein